MLLGLVEFEKCAILILNIDSGRKQLGLVEFEKCAIFKENTDYQPMVLGLVEFEKCAIFGAAAKIRLNCWGL